MDEETDTMKSCLAVNGETVKLLHAAEGWMGTPFHPHAAIKGAGVDCVRLALSLYQEVGILPVGIPLPEYDVGSGPHLSDSHVSKWMKKQPNFVRIETANVLIDWSPGDMLGFLIGKVVHHVGICLDYQQFVHVMSGGEVAVSTIADATWWKRLREVWRPVAKAAEVKTPA